LTTPSQEQVNQKLLGAWNAHLVFIGPGEVFKRSNNLLPKYSTEINKK
jgi:hypothetical protein